MSEIDPRQKHWIGRPKWSFNHEKMMRNLQNGFYQHEYKSMAKYANKMFFTGFYLGIAIMVATIVILLGLL